MATVEAVYVVQPYMHLRPLVRRARRLGLHLVSATPSETPLLIEKLDSDYCGLTPLPLILRYSLEVHPGPMVWTGRCSPSLVLITPDELEPCRCSTLVVTRESISTRMYASLLAERCEFSVETMALDARAAVRLAESGVCTLLIGDEGVRAWTASRGRRVRLYEFSPLAASILGTGGLAFAATAGPGCRRIGRVLKRLSRVEPSLVDELKAAWSLGVPLSLAARYLRCTRLSFDTSILRASLRLLSKRRECSQAGAATSSSSLGGGNLL